MTIQAKFSGKCVKCSARFEAGTSIDWTKGVGAQHVVCPAVVVAPAPVAPVATTISVGDFSGVIALFKQASTRLKFPKVALLCEGRTLSLAVAGPRSKTPGSITVVGEGQYPNRPWYGRVSPEGEWITGRDGAVILGALTALLKEFAARPAEVAAAHGKLTGHCCFCHKKLTDAGSVEVGYGKVCAGHWGLPHKAKGTPALSPVVAA